MSQAIHDLNRRLLRARDAMDRTYAQQLDVPALATIAHVSEAHFIRSFRTTFGETPHRYLQRRVGDRTCGIDCGVRDPFGNSVRFSQPPAG